MALESHKEARAFPVLLNFDLELKWWWHQHPFPIPASSLWWECKVGLDTSCLSRE